MSLEINLDRLTIFVGHPTWSLCMRIKTPRHALFSIGKPNINVYAHVSIQTKMHTYNRHMKIGHCIWVCSHYCPLLLTACVFQSASGACCCVTLQLLPQETTPAAGVSRFWTILQVGCSSKTESVVTYEAYADFENWWIGWPGKSPFSHRENGHGCLWYID